MYERWVAAGYFEADATSDKPPYSIVLPPPNVTGNLHMGHALDHTIMDALTRRKRMQGYEVLWLPGMDHAGIATQTIVEKQLAVELDTSGAVDLDAERRRLEKDLAAAEKELAGTTAKLGNEAFLAKAPEPVVVKIKDRQEVAAAEVARIGARLAELSSK